MGQVSSYYRNSYSNSYNNISNYMKYESREINPDAIRFVRSNNDGNNCIFTIETEKFDNDELENIKNYLKTLNNSYIDGINDDVIEILKYNINNENKAILEQTDSFMFHRYNGLPILEIKNKNTSKYRKEHNIKDNRLYSSICYLDKIWRKPKPQTVTF